jgi:hypothetical protein
VPDLGFSDAEPRVEPRSLAPVARKDLGHAGLGRDHRPRRLHPGPQVAELALGGTLVRLPRVVGEPARCPEPAEAEEAGRGGVYTVACPVTFVSSVVECTERVRDELPGFVPKTKARESAVYAGTSERTHPSVPLTLPNTSSQ